MRGAQRDLLKVGQAGNEGEEYLVGERALREWQMGREGQGSNLVEGEQTGELAEEFEVTKVTDKGNQ